MDDKFLREYLAVRRDGWDCAELYRVEASGSHRFVAWVGDEIAGVSWADVSETAAKNANGDKSEAQMHMSLKSEYAEYGIGTELMELLMTELRESGFNRIRYEIGLEHYSFQIYERLGFETEYRDSEKIAFLWEGENCEGENCEGENRDGEKRLEDEK